MKHTLPRLWRSPILLAATFAGLAVLLAPAWGHEIKAGGLTIVHPWARATLPGLTNSTGYMVIRNAGPEADRLIAASIEGAARVELHSTTTTAEGVMQMRPVPDGVEVPAQDEVQLAPNGTHLMVMGLATSLVTDTAVPGTLTFAKAGKVPVEFVIHPPGSRGEAHQH